MSSHGGDGGGVEHPLAVVREHDRPDAADPGPDRLQQRRLDIVSGTTLWYHPAKQVPVRWLLVRDPAGAFKPQAFLCTDQGADPVTILQLFVRRWSVEVTFAEVRRHLGVEMQRQ